MLKAKTLKQLAILNSPTEKICETVCDFLKSAGVENCVPYDDIIEIEHNGIMLCIGTNCMYAINYAGTVIDNLLDKRCKLEVFCLRQKTKAIYKK